MAPVGRGRPAVSPACGPLHFLGPSSSAYMFAAPGRGLNGAPLLGAQGAEGSSGSSEAPRLAHVFAATFQCVWYLALGPEHSSTLVAWWRKKCLGRALCLLEEQCGELPQLALDAGRKRREEAAANKRPWRKRLMRQRKQAAKQAGGGGGSGSGGGAGDS